VARLTAKVMRPSSRFAVAVTRNAAVPNHARGDAFNRRDMASTANAVATAPVAGTPT
jgi:hypothetical protein